ncbi:hypothetical protein [Olleya aquimaris]|uniref:Uncharacterized protein n=1 Tax=Olleya aquimaris TaxID=639310 RepID=A0A327RK98_9FLAO|nr:hypothetical protein [Olleya aquimaris]RAJ16841.1 hypothetical protein LY08_00617 [Olleya aquimaris]
MQPITQLLDNDTFVKRVQYLIITLFILLIAFDIYLAIDNSVEGDTISNIIKSYTDNGLYILTFFWGALAANFFFPTKHTLLVSRTVGSIILIVFAIFIYWFSLGTMVKNMIGPTENDIRIAHAIYMVFGFLMAFLFWRQPAKSSL